MKRITFLLSFLFFVFFWSNSFSQTGTINFSTADNTNLGVTADDGEGGSSDIAGVIFQITAVNVSGLASMLLRKEISIHS